MRESRTFAERTRVLNSDEVIRKYFLVFEGSDTEVIYFDAVRSLREEIGINPLIELVPMVRSFSEEGWSNPKKILDRVIENLKESEEQVLSYESLLNRIMEYFYEAKIITTSRVLARSIWNTMRRFCEEELQKSLYDRVEDTDSVCHMLMELLKTEYQIVNLVDDISEIIKNGGLTYEEGFDQICFIVDRDKDSFVSVPGNNQYQYVLDKEKLLENPKVTAKRRYAEQELHRICRGYRKTSYDAEAMVRNIDQAINNEKKFCEEIEELEGSLGSNIGRLIAHMRDKTEE